MPQALSAAYLHLIFSTKERRPFLREPILRARLHEYLGGISKELDCHPVRIGGVEDHVHLLCRFGRTISQADWVKELKRVSSTWLKQTESSLHDFGWQGGYATFSVSASKLADTERYIERQEEHHRKVSFQEELRLILRKHQLEWDERYLWD
jgi:putative transposase